MNIHIDDPCSGTGSSPTSSPPEGSPPVRTCRPVVLGVTDLLDLREEAWLRQACRPARPRRPGQAGVSRRPRRTPPCLPSRWMRRVPGPGRSVPDKISIRRPGVVLVEPHHRDPTRQKFSYREGSPSALPACSPRHGGGNASYLMLSSRPGDGSGRDKEAPHDRCEPTVCRGVARRR